MIDVAQIISNKWLIIGIEASAAVLLIIALFYTYKIYQMTKKTTDIWLLISFVVLNVASIFYLLLVKTRSLISLKVFHRLFLELILNIVNKKRED